jgi:hypothetical protein
VGGSASSFDPKQVGKSDIDRVADAHRRAIFSSVRVLAEKLYRRNPREWKKGGHASIEKALDRLLDPRTGWRVAEAAGRTGTEAILLSLRRRLRRRPGGRVHRRHGRHAERGLRGKDGILHARRTRTRRSSTTARATLKSPPGSWPTRAMPAAPCCCSAMRWRRAGSRRT